MEEYKAALAALSQVYAKLSADYVARSQGSTAQSLPHMRKTYVHLLHSTTEALDLALSTLEGTVITPTVEPHLSRQELRDRYQPFYDIAKALPAPFGEALPMAAYLAGRGFTVDHIRSPDFKLSAYAPEFRLARAEAGSDELHLFILGTHDPVALQRFGEIGVVMNRTEGTTPTGSGILGYLTQRDVDGVLYTENINTYDFAKYLAGMGVTAAHLTPEVWPQLRAYLKAWEHGMSFGTNAFLEAYA